MEPLPSGSSSGLEPHNALKANPGAERLFASSNMQAKIPPKAGRPTHPHSPLVPRLAAQTHAAAQVVKAWDTTLCSHGGRLLLQRNGSHCYASATSRGAAPRGHAAQRMHDELLGAALALDEHSDQEVRDTARHLLHLLLNLQTKPGNAQELKAAIGALSAKLGARRPQPAPRPVDGSPPPAVSATPPTKSSKDRPPGLKRFIQAQGQVAPHDTAGRDAYAVAMEEIRTGKKRTHWSWWMFPQPPFGRSALAKTYAITSAQEARAFFVDPVLGRRLVDAARAMLAHRQSGKTAKDILGEVDAVKFRSCMTLFAKVAPEEAVFARALNDLCDGPDPMTLQWLQAQA